VSILEVDGLNSEWQKLQTSGVNKIRPQVLQASHLLRMEDLDHYVGNSASKADALIVKSSA